MTTPAWSDTAKAAAGGGDWWETGGDEASQLDLTMFDVQIKHYQSVITAQQAIIDKLKGVKNPTTAQKQQLVHAQRQIRAVQAQLNLTGAKRTTAQNKYYEQTGQYGKLLTGANRDAFLAIQSLFDSYGLGTLAGKIYDYVKNGYSSDTISILLQDTDEYKTRFAGNEARKKAGLPVLSPAKYLAIEASYRQIMKAAGLPASFYDQTSDFAKWIGDDTSPTEIQTRVDLATQATTLAAPAYRQALNQMGIDDAHLTAYYLDPTKALPLLQKQAATAQIGAEALKQGLAFDQAYAAQLATEGVSQSAAAQGYAQVANELGTMQNLGALYGQSWTQRESEQSVLEGTATVTAKKAGLLSQERGQFGAAAGTGRAGLSQSKAQG